MDDHDYTEAITIDDAIRKEYGVIENIQDTDPVDFYACANIGFPTFSWSKPVEDPVGIAEVAMGHKVDRMLATIQTCVKHGYDWDVDEHHMEVMSHALSERDHEDYIKSL
jgi:hypothetical protein